MTKSNFILKTVFVTLFCLFISGCAGGLGGDYTCQKVGGISGCSSMDEIRGNMGAFIEYGKTGEVSEKVTSSKLPVFFDLPRRNRQGNPSRTDTNIIKVTIFPFLDSSGNYIDTTDVYMILEDDEWIGRLPREIIKD